MAKSVNDLIGQLAYNAGKMSTEPITSLRLRHPDNKDGDSETTFRPSREDCIEAILFDEFSLEFDDYYDTDEDA